MKYHKIEGKLPVGVSLKVQLLGATSPERGLFDAQQLIDSISRYSSNVPMTFTIDVPEGTEIETARVLRAMADELNGGRP